MELDRYKDKYGFKLNRKDTSYGCKGVFAEELIPKFSTIMKVAPLSFCIDSNSMHTICHYCLKDCSSNYCSGCKTINYCSRECQAADWKCHKKECKFIKKIHDDEHYAKHGLDSLAIMAIRAMMMIRDQARCRKIYISNRKSKDDLEVIEGDYNDIASLTYAQSENFVFCSILSKMIMDILGIYMEDKYVHNMIRLIQTNSFSSIYPVTILYPILSLINHSCDHNVEVTFDGLVGNIVSNRDIQAGEELTINYSITSSCYERNQLFRENYDFQCHCCYCHNATLFKQSMAFYCDCGGIYYPCGDVYHVCRMWRCEKCHKEKVDNEYYILSSRQEFSFYDTLKTDINEYLEKGVHYDVIYEKYHHLFPEYSVYHSYVCSLLLLDSVMMNDRNAFTYLDMVIRAYDQYHCLFLHPTVVVKELYQQMKRGVLLSDLQLQIVDIIREKWPIDTSNYQTLCDTTNK